MPRSYVRSEDGQRFERRRCPHCRSGQYEAVPSLPGHRQCRTCKGVFHLEREGVKLTPARKRKRPEGSGVVAGPVLIGRGFAMWR
jgi:hypothetical protein